MPLSKIDSDSLNSPITADDLGVSGNLTFTGTGNRITGDFSNATIANRVMFQSSTTNGATEITAIPNGTSVNGNVAALNNTDPTNAGRIRIGLTDTISYLDSGRLGTGTYLPMTFYTGGSERMRIDSSGNVGIGTTPYTKLQVTGTIKVATGNAQGILSLGDGGGASVNCGVWRGAANAPTTDGNYLNFGGYDGLVFATGNAAIGSQTERARIDSSGNLLVGTTSTSGVQLATAGGLVANGTENFWLSRSAGGGSTMNVGRTSGAGTGTLVEWTYNGATRGTVTTNGTTVAYNTSSDYRLKEAIAPMTGALAKIAALKPVTYKWKSTGESDEGFIAHELAEVCPSAVSGEKDATDADGNPQYQGIDTSFLVATLTAAIQELKAIVDAQGAEIAALKGAP